MELQGRVKMALVYPCAMLAVGFATVVLLVTLVVPMFVKVFQESGQTLPLPTRMLVVISDFVAAWWWAILPGLGVAIFSLARYISSPSGKALMSRVLIRLPLFGGVFRKTEIASFGRTLGILLGNGIPIMQALQVTSTTLKNLVYGEAIMQMGPPIRDGASLSKTFEKHPLFPPVVADMISVGEESGMLSEKLIQLADEYEREVERELKVVMTLLEPLMILLVGVVVGFIVMAIILPVFALGDTLQQ
jgi:type II secretory pathway component PulF